MSVPLIQSTPRSTPQRSATTTYTPLTEASAWTLVTSAGRSPAGHGAAGQLTGAAIRQYDQLFALVAQQAPKQKLVVTTRVASIGVEFLTGDRARVLVFANQQDTRAGTSQASYAGAMFAVTAVSRSGHWLIEDIDTFSSPG